MKKFLLSVATVVAASAAFSADQFYVIMKDGSVESYPTDKVDSLSFDDPQIAKIMGFNDMAAEIVKLKERVEALEAGMGKIDTTIPSSASDFRYFVLNDKEAELIGFVNGSPNLIIPEKTSVGGKVYTVTSIGNNAFEGLKNLKTVELPKTITTIGNEAFRGCEELTDVNIPSGVTTIGQFAFENCRELTSIEMPSSVTTIEYGAFAGCGGLKSVSISSGVINIGQSAFYNCSGLTSIDIPSGVTTIGENAFYNCSGLTSIDIPSSVTTIGVSAFGLCKSADVYVDNVLDSVKFNMAVFMYCKSVTLKDGTSYAVEPNVSVVAGGEYFVRHPSVDFSFKVKSVKGGYLTKDQVVEIEIEGNIFTMSDAGAVFLMWTEEYGFRMVNMVEAKENAKYIVMYLSCANSTANYTISSPAEHDSLKTLGAIGAKFWIERGN